MWKKIEQKLLKNSPMRCIVSPVESASVEIVEMQEVRSIWKWLLIYVGVSQEDIAKSWAKEFFEKVVHKIAHTKLFHSEETQKIDTSLMDFHWEILCISNFTLYGNFNKWTKVDFWEWAKFQEAKIIYDHLCSLFTDQWISLKTWEFWAKMRIKSENLGPLNYIFEY